jgi:hypothetical protein
MSMSAIAPSYPTQSTPEPTECGAPTVVTTPTAAKADTVSAANCNKALFLLDFFGGNKSQPTE